MDLTYSYAKEKFMIAVSILATGTLAIQERLENAFVSSLISLQDKDIPEDLRPDFASFRERLTKERPQGNEGTVRATVQNMTDTEAVELAKIIVNMAYAIIDVIND